ncbi:MAG: hypothetical protein NXH85_01975 [Pseudomonadaceae bacterium]|nr:hypothetical protein [Pseudomonadaceae bacterium]
MKFQSSLQVRGEIMIWRLLNLARKLDKRWPGLLRIVTPHQVARRAEARFDATIG